MNKSVESINQHDTEIKDYRAFIEKLGYASFEEEIPEDVSYFDPHQQD